MSTIWRISGTYGRPDLGVGMTAFEQNVEATTILQAIAKVQQQRLLAVPFITSATLLATTGVSDAD